MLSVPRNSNKERGCSKPLSLFIITSTFTSRFLYNYQDHPCLTGTATGRIAA
jgi:hypothetical protein